MRTQIAERLGCDVPIFAFSHCRDVVVEVTKAGGFGVLGAATFAPGQLEAELRWIDDHVSGRPYGVDVLIPTRYDHEAEASSGDPALLIPESHRAFMARLLEAEGVPDLPPDERARIHKDIVEGRGAMTPDGARQLVQVVLRHPGVKLLVSALGAPPGDIVTELRQRDILLGALCGKASHAVRQLKAGVQLIVAQGTEAGGHTGEISTLVLVPQVVDVCPPAVPVLAAGGICRGSQIAAALALGAQGVWCGTIWLGTRESELTPFEKQVLFDTSTDNAVRRRVRTGKTVRLTKSRMSEAWEQPGAPGYLLPPLQGILFNEAHARIVRAERADLCSIPAGQVRGDDDLRNLGSGTYVSTANGVCYYDGTSRDDRRIMIPRTLFSAEHDLFRDQVRRFIAAEITPHHAEWEKAGIVPRSVWHKAGALGLLCTGVPEAYGGAGGDFLFGAIIVEEMARAGATGPTFYLQSEIVAPYLVHYGTEAQKRRWLPPMATGDVVVSLGMSEPSGGSDVAAMRTTARRDGDDYVINGQKVFITAGHSADLLMLACKTDPTAGARGVSLILVETDRPGFQRGRMLDKIGCKAQDTAELFFFDMRVPVSNLLGEEGRGFYQLMKELAQERLVQAIRAVASSEAALEWTVDYTVQREMFGQTLADFQNTQFRLAEMKADLTMQRVFLDRCIELHLRNELDAVDAAILKLVTAELQGRVMDQCLQFFGGWGYMTEFPIARAFVDARMGRIGGGSVETMKGIIARSMLPNNAKRKR